MFCRQCGNEIADAAAICMRCGVPTGGARIPGSSAKGRTAFVLLGLFLGFLGVHNFYAGYTGRAVAQLLICILTGWLILPLVALFIWIIVEICVVTTDAQGHPFS